MSLKENLQLAKEAIRYVDKLKIKSVNVPFRITTHHKLSALDGFLFRYMRAETNEDYSGVIPNWQAIKDIRHRILEVLRSNKTKHQKKKDLQNLMKIADEKKVLKQVYQWHTRTNRADEHRIRCCRKAIKFKHGNCGEKSAIAATHLLEQAKTKGHDKAILWCTYGTRGDKYDHSFVLLADREGRLTVERVEQVSHDDGWGVSYFNYVSNWDENTVVVDAWTSDYYAAKHPFNPLKAGSIANPFQAYVRRKVDRLYHDNRNIKVLEVVHENWPPKFDPDFRLENAHLSKREHKRTDIQIRQSLPAIQEVADDARAILAELEDYDYYIPPDD